MSADGRQIKRRTERRLLPPFGDGRSPNSLSNLLDSILENCQFAPFRNEPTTESSHYLDPADTGRLIEPLFVFDLNSIDEVLSRLRVTESHLELGVSVRNRHLQRYKVLGQWSVADLPAQWSPAMEDLDEVQTGGTAEFILAVRVVADGPTLAEQGLGVGKVLCRREFAVRPKVDAVTFPASWREFGGDTEYPSELLWTIKWEDAEGDERYQRPVDEVLTVYMNKAAEERLVAMNAAAGKGDLMWRMLAAEIIVLIWSEVLKGTSSDPDPSDRETLAGQVYHLLAEECGRSYAELNELVEEDGLLELRALVAQIVGVVS